MFIGSLPTDLCIVLCAILLRPRPMATRCSRCGSPVTVRRRVQGSNAPRLGARRDRVPGSPPAGAPVPLPSEMGELELVRKYRAWYRDVTLACPPMPSSSLPATALRDRLAGLVAASTSDEGALLKGDLTPVDNLRPVRTYAPPALITGDGGRDL
jgi:hypothetical protein